MARLTYPLGESRAARLRALSERPLDHITVDACAAGELGPDDIAITPATLRLQAEVARGAGRAPLAQNLERAAEMVSIPADVVFDIYEKLRPGRARDAAELLAVATRLRSDFGAELLAGMVEEAAAAYEDRKLYQPRFRLNSD
jgi:propanediol dehydratase small subunit